MAHKTMMVFFVFMTALLAGLAVLAQAGQVQAPAKPAVPAPTPMTVEKLAENLYWFKGGVMANAGFYVGDKNVFVIDVKMTPEAAKAMIAAIAQITPKPIGEIILTHSDADHVNGLTAFPLGLGITSSDNTRKEMEQAFKDEKMAAYRAYLPNVTFTGHIEVEGLPAMLYCFGPAHTSGDTVVFFPKAKVAFIGDLAFIGRDPLIHRQKGGTSFGLAKTLHEILKLDAAVFIAGHNDPLSRADLEGLVKGIEEKQAKVKDLIAAGKTLDEIKKAMGVEEQSVGGRRWPSLIEVIYLDITEKRF